MIHLYQASILQNLETDTIYPAFIVFTFATSQPFVVDSHIWIQWQRILPRGHRDSRKDPKIRSKSWIMSYLTLTMPVVG